MALTAQHKNLLGLIPSQLPGSPPAVSTAQCPELCPFKGSLEARIPLGPAWPHRTINKLMPSCWVSRVGSAFPLRLQAWVMSLIGLKPNYFQHHESSVWHKGAKGNTALNLVTRADAITSFSKELEPEDSRGQLRQGQAALQSSRGHTWYIGEDATLP